MKKFTKILKNQKGLTLIELLAVIVILAIVAAIAVPAIGNVINNSKDKAILSEAANILSAGKLAVTEGSCTENSTTVGNYTCSATQLQPYIEGVTTATADSVSKSAGIWSVKYSRFSELKDKTKYNVSSDTVNEAQLNVLLKK
ncbi:prepilin-type N-terminal cleavage/methylation domain-containing protein [Psychrobacillus glaciei]|uniref:Prepilin-type N-terminal cleavage/methylation domain-containing protein n=2 Tax=Psychrobacillus glaciei TaxID=2283160 RepID=A0A5J6SXY7_9BACI|nr:prepilin-type N-terminal cleavage/methylation domain-containing protein [Psychrobacillus glaciei]